MYCEKCGKMNPDGAIFCSNCSSILRSRRAKSNAAPDDETRRMPITEPAEKEVPVAVKVKTPVYEEPVVKAAVKTQPKHKNIAERAEQSVYTERHKPLDSIIEDDENVNGSSAWMGILTTVSWLMFIALATIGIAAGGWMMLYGFGGNGYMFSFGGIAFMIICIVVGLAILSKNLLYIKMAKDINNLKYRRQ